MSVDWSKVGSKAAATAAKHEDRKSDDIAAIGEAIGRLHDQDPYHPVIHVVKVVLNLVKDGNVQEALVKAGLIELPTDNEDVEPTAPLKGYALAYEHDGTPLGTGFKSEDEARAAGFEPWLDTTDGSLKGWRKPAPAAIAPPSPDTRTVNVRKGSETGPVVGTITLAEYMADKGRYKDPVLNDEGIVTDVVQKKVRFGSGG